VENWPVRQDNVKLSNMLFKEKSIRQEKKIKGKQILDVYIFNCTGCDTEIIVQETELRTHFGICRRCNEIKKHNNYLHRELKKQKKSGLNIDINFEHLL